MKKILSILILSIVLHSCSSKKEGNMIVQGQIKGLKKGKLYLQKMVDTVLVSVDSVTLLGKDTFTLTDNVDSPVLYYLTLDGNTIDKRILFFAEAGIITINDQVDQFGFNPKITGSKNQEILDRYNVISKRFQDERLDFIKKDFEAKQSKDTDLIEKVQTDYKRMVRKRVLYTTNFALTNADLEVAPYLALTEMYDASLKMLDTVNSKLSPKVKNSIYGQRFQEYLETIKKAEAAK
ncbi:MULTISPECIES: DUF4369 domain-containing protein [unclassified Polaribacter]|uniref:DUF4369 domain-containing protein n=1 Tax=unclassified Polaribacter TaxID=196858 RepID=UPI0011BEAD8E|nr:MULTISPECIES: DUF4369 domain-containing protein [unclassified Polaribacter]TXD51942.1 DUF4369 domain-containing protein [Polaribacter sp. IC063]TXD59714.1 DUF4369 domain-containing protein [Polaribacter sp. IC066]